MDDDYIALFNLGSRVLQILGCNKLPLFLGDVYDYPCSVIFIKRYFMCIFQALNNMRRRKYWNYNNGKLGAPCAWQPN